MGADQHIDTVDLMERQPVDGPHPPRGRDLFGARSAEALGCKSDPTRLGE